MLWSLFFWWNWINLISIILFTTWVLLAWFTNYGSNIQEFTFGIGTILFTKTELQIPCDWIENPIWNLTQYYSCPARPATYGQLWRINGALERTPLAGRWANLPPDSNRIFVFQTNSMIIFKSVLGKTHWKALVFIGSSFQVILGF